MAASNKYGSPKEGIELCSFLYDDEDIVTAEYSMEYGMLQNVKKFKEDTTVSDANHNEEEL